MEKLRTTQNAQVTLLKSLIFVGGYNVVAPDELREQMLEKMGCSDEEKKNINEVAQYINELFPNNKKEALFALRMVMLAPDEWVDLKTADDDEIFKFFMYYINEHPEHKQDISKEDTEGFFNKLK